MKTLPRYRPLRLAVIIVCTLAMAIGLNTAVFTVLRGVLRPNLPFAAPERLIALAPQSTQEVTDDTIAGPSLLTWRAETKAPAGIVGVVPRQAAIQAGSVTVRVEAAHRRLRLVRARRPRGRPARALDRRPGQGRAFRQHSGWARCVSAC